ncbi:MAG: hypothetical protein JJT85_02845 [Chromatiales bacterium]|nr:hypothetical protein [Chromatiales bacterium]
MPQLARGGCLSIAGMGLGVLLAGCGGGSGGSGQGSSQSAAVLQPHSQPEISLSRARTAEVTEEFLFQVEIALYFAAIGVGLANLPPGQAETMSATGWVAESMPCSEGGTMTSERLTGAVGSPLGAGDSVRVQFTACRDLGVTFNGEVRLDISALNPGPDTHALVGQVSLPGLRLSSAGITLTMSAMLPVTYDGDESTDRFRIAGGWLQVSGPAGRETLTGLMLDLRQDYATFRYELDLSATLTSDWLRGQVHGSTTQALAGQIGQWPSFGRLEFSGAGSRTVELQTSFSLEGSRNVGASLVDQAAGDVLETWTVAWPIGFIDMLDPLREDVEPPAGPPPGHIGPWPPPPGTGPEPAAARRIQLGAPPTDLVVDEPRRLFYVAVPERNEIVAIDLDTLLVDRRIRVAGRPRRLSLSLDGDTLFATANAAGSVVAVNLADDSTRRIDIVVELNHLTAWDLLEYQPGKLLVTGNPGSSGSSYIVDVDLATGEVARVANGEIVRSEPYLVHRPGDPFAYVGQSRSTGTLMRLDLEAPGIPIVLESPPFTLGGTYHMAMSADGTRIVLDGSQVVSTDSLAPELELPGAGRPQFSRDGTELLLWTRELDSSRMSAAIEVYAGDTLERVDEWASVCGPTGLGASRTTHLRHLDKGRWAILRDTEVCISDRDNPDQPPGLGDSPLPAPPAEQAIAGSRLEFSGLVDSVIADAPAGLVYVSIPVTGEVHRISAATRSVEQTFQLPGQPHGLDLSPDGSVLYVVVTPGAGPEGSVVRIATDTGAHLGETAIEHRLGPVPAQATAVLSVAPGRMLVDAGNGIIEIFDYANPLSLTVAGANAYTGSRMLRAPDGGPAYLGSNASPRSILRIDLDGVIASASGPDSSGGTTLAGMMAISPDGSRLYLQSGQVIGTDTLMPAGQIGAGVPQPLRNGSAILVAPAPGVLERYDAGHEGLTARYTTDCSTAGVSHLVGLLGDTVWLVIGGNVACVVVLPEG